MNITEAAVRAGLSAKALRYYEEIGLLKTGRRGNGYRDYGPKELAKLKFLSRARGLGFSVEECRHLVALWEDRSRASADVKAMAEAHIGEIEHKIAELRAMKATLARLVHACHGDDRPDCPILEDLAGT